MTLVHKGNIMKFTEGAFRDWGYELARTKYNGEIIDGGPWTKIKTGDGKEIIIKDVIADAMLQQILTRPAEYDVIATLNLNGDYISDALAAQVGGIGIAPGGNINYHTGHAIFEATHGTAPKYAGQDKVNPGVRHPLRRNDAAPPRLERSRRPDHQGHGRRDRQQGQSPTTSTASWTARRCSSAVNLAKRSSSTWVKPHKARQSRVASCVRPGAHEATRLVTIFTYEAPRLAALSTYEATRLRRASGAAS